MIKFTRQHDPILRNSLLLAWALFSLGASPARAGEEMATPGTHLLTLQDCIAMALQESPALEASRFDVASATEEVKAARARLLPDLSAQASVQAFSGSPSSRFSVVNLGDQGSVVVGNNSKSVDLGEVEIYSARLALSTL